MRNPKVKQDWFFFFPTNKLQTEDFEHIVLKNDQAGNNPIDSVPATNW